MMYCLLTALATQLWLLLLVVLLLLRCLHMNTANNFHTLQRQ
jgi:hypothetical protein